MNSIPRLKEGCGLYIYLHGFPTQPIEGKLVAQSLDGLIIDGDEFQWSMSIADIAVLGVRREGI